MRSVVSQLLKPAQFASVPGRDTREVTRALQSPAAPFNDHSRKSFEIGVAMKSSTHISPVFAIVISVLTAGCVAEAQVPQMIKCQWRVIFAATPTNGVSSFGRFINQ